MLQIKFSRKKPKKKPKKCSKKPGWLTRFVPTFFSDKHFLLILYSNVCDIVLDSRMTTETWVSGWLIKKRNGKKWKEQERKLSYFAKL